MAKIDPLDDVGSLANTTSARSVINNNAQKIEEAFANTLSRNGEGPNQMEADIDLNDHYLLNVADPVNASDGVNLRSVGPLVEQFAAQIVGRAVFGTQHVDSFTAGVGQYQFALTYSPGSIDNTAIFVDGVALEPNVDFTLSGPTLQLAELTTPLTSGEKVVIRYSLALPSGVTDSDSVIFREAVTNAVDRSVEARLRDLPLYVQAFGAQLNGTTDDTTAYENAILGAQVTGRPLHLGTGQTKLSRQLTIPANVEVLYDELTLDFSAVTSSGSFPNNSCVYAVGGSLVALPAISVNIPAGALSITFAAPPTVQRGDIIVIADPTDFSFSGFRNYYRKGEHVKVRSVAGNVVTLWTPTLAAYTAGVAVGYLFPNSTTAFKGGNLRIKGSDDVYSALRVRYMRDAVLENVSVDGALGATVSIDECHNVRFYGLDTSQDTNSGQGTDYGLVLNNCHIVEGDGIFMGRRHGATTGGAGTGGISVPTRHVKLTGKFVSLDNSSATLGGFNAHGNTEFWHVEGDFIGGLQPGGDHGVARGRVYVDGSGESAISGTECLGTDFDLRHMKIVCAAGVNPGANSRGVIDFGGNADVITANTTRGGTIALDGVEIDAPDSIRSIVLRNAGYVGTEPIRISCRGAVLKRIGVTANSFRLTVTSGNNFALLDLDGFDNVPNTGYIVSGVSRIIGWKAAGRTTITPSTGATTATLGATFVQQAPRAPRVTATVTGSTNAGTARVLPYTASISQTGFNVTIATSDNANFQSATARDVDWIAILDE